MVNATKLKNFIEKICLNNTISTFVIRPEEEGVGILAKSLDNTTMVFGSFKGLTITENLPIKSAASLIDALTFVGGEIVVERKENKLFLSSTKDGKVRSREVGLVDEEYAKDTHLDEIPPFEYKGAMKVSLNDIKDMVKQFKDLGEHWVQFKVANNTLSLFTEGDTDNAKIDTKVEYHDCIGHYGIPFAVAASALVESEIEISLHHEKDLYPIRLVQKGDDYSCTIIVAPKELTPEEVEEKAPVEEPEVEEPKAEVGDF